MSEVAQRKNIIIHQNVNTSTDFYVSIPDLGFVPDEVIIKQIAYDDVANNDTYLIWSNLTQDFIALFISGMCNSPDIRLPIQQPLQSQLRFVIYSNSTTRVANGTLNGYLGIVLSFVKYAK
jgi:hypothetical protein